jgi:hypothetical protein
MKRKTFLVAVAVMSVCGVIGSSYGATKIDNDALTITATKVSLVQAIATAEKYVGGVASRAEYEQHKGHGVFDIEVVKGASVMDVMVDAGNGKVIDARADITDRAGEREDDEDQVDQEN